MKKIIFIVASIVFLFTAPQVMAVSFDLVGVEYNYLGAHVNFTYSSSSSTDGKIDITIQNTSADPYGILTGFTFNSPDEITSVTNFTAKDNNDVTLTTWNYTYDEGGVDTPGSYGLFDVAGRTGTNLNGGDPNDGIDPNLTFSFSFTITGSGLDQLTENSFLSEYSDPQNKNSDIQYFLARFQRVAGEDLDYSDVAIPNPIPEPATLILLGTGLIGLAGASRKKIMKKR